jgi:hypothetical protein
MSIIRLEAIKKKEMKFSIYLMTFVNWEDKSVLFVMAISESVTSDEDCFWPMVNWW